jgi:aminoglycoside phosphotransferase family enzyme/predicted kinase
VLLFGDRVVKWKKPLDLGFVDWTGVGQREHACREEVRLNRRFAPDVYRDVLAVSDSSGAVCEWLVVMDRMPAEKRLSTMISEGRLVDDDLRAVAHLLATHHASARRSDRIAANGEPEALLARWMSNLEALRQHQVVDAATLGGINDLAGSYIAGRRPLLQQRVADGHIRDGHGDLLAEDIFCLSDGPRVLDCLEFDDDLRAVDGVDDAAVLAMDLERLGAPELGREFVNRFVEFAGDPCPPSLIHHYIAYRAVMRAKIAAIRVQQGDTSAADQARLLAAIGLRHLRLGRPTLVLVGGLPGTGKTTIAAALADDLEYVVIRSDRIRKEIAGLDPNHHCAAPPGLYSAAMTERTYRVMLARAGQLLRRGESVLLDATWQSARARAGARGLAARTSSGFAELRCTAPQAVADSRIGERATAGDDASDATVAVARDLATTFEPWPEATVIDTSVARPDSVAAASAAIAAIR